MVKERRKEVAHQGDGDSCGSGGGVAYLKGEEVAGKVCALVEGTHVVCCILINKSL